MNDKTEIAQVEKKSLVKTIAHKYGVEESQMLTTLKATCFSQGNNKPEVTNEQMMALLVVANEYNLNPFTREIYAFPQNGGIVPIVGIDGWLNIINSHSQFDGMEFEEKFDDDGKLVSCTCKIHRKDRKYPTEVTEYLSECKMNTKPWTDKPVRMLRHKTTIQCGRYAFGFSGIFDEDDAAVIKDIGGGGKEDVIDVAPVEVTLPEYQEDQFKTDSDDWKALIIGGKKKAVDIINMLKMKWALSENQENTIYSFEDM